MISYGWLLLVSVACVHAQNCSNYYTCQIALYDRLLSQSRPSIRPIEYDGQRVNVRLGFSLIRLVSVNEEKSLLTIRAHINQTWNASVLTWNSTAYQNVQHIRVPAHSVWTPKVELINPSTEIDSEAHHFIDVRANGTFDLSYSTLLTIPCNFDLTNFPFDQQSCTFKLGSSVYDIDEVAISQAIDSVIDEPSLMPNGFYFVSHSIERTKSFFAGFDRSYDLVSIQFTIHRRPKYFIRLINWPGCALLILTTTMFFLPPLAMERIVLGSLSLMGQFVLLAIFAFHVPKRLGTEWPWMGRMIFYDILLTTGSLVFSVTLRALADGTHYSTRRPSIRIRRFVADYLTKLIAFKRSSCEIFIAHRESEYDANDLAMNDPSMEPLAAVSSGSASTSDPLVLLSNSMGRDITSIKQKLNVVIHEHQVHQEWILLAHIINRLGLLVYLFFSMFSVGFHTFYKWRD